MHQTDFPALSAPANTKSADLAEQSAEVCLEEKSITRLVDPPFFSIDMKDLGSGLSGKRKIEIVSMIVVCLLALFCCLFAKGQNDKLVQENARLQRSYSIQAIWDSQDRERLQAELNAVRQQVQTLAIRYRRIQPPDSFLRAQPAVASPPNESGRLMPHDNLSNSNASKMVTYGPYRFSGRTYEELPGR